MPMASKPTADEDPGGSRGCRQSPRGLLARQAGMFNIPILSSTVFPPPHGGRPNPHPRWEPARGSRMLSESGTAPVMCPPGQALGLG
eukprot:scaffold1522_cov340-Prasinococcus_capsulatus_cf.AAC.23